MKLDFPFCSNTGRPEGFIMSIEQMSVSVGTCCECFVFFLNLYNILFDVKLKKRM